MTESHVTAHDDSSHPDALSAGEIHNQGFDRQLILALLVCAAVVFPRSIDVALSHTESWDDFYHAKRGLLFLTGSLVSSLVPNQFWINDPPLGQGLMMLPRLAVNWYYGHDLHDINRYTQPPGRDALAVMMGVWKSLLFMPLVAVAFLWCRSLYGVRAAWLAAMLLTFEPSFAAHIPVTTVDVLGVTGLGIAAYLGWRFVERPSSGRAAAVGFATGAALMTKHTAIVLPVLYGSYGVLIWLVRPVVERVPWKVIQGDLFRNARLSVLAVVVCVLSIWALSGFDVSPISRAPIEPGSTGLRAELHKLSRRSWPAGIYFVALKAGRYEGSAGRANYLFGETKETGWWYYFPVLMTYKMPLGIAALFLLAVVTIWSTGPRWGDLSLLIAWFGWTALVMVGKLNLGIRHYLPAYFFFLLFCSRALIAPTAWRSVIAWVAVATVAIHSLSYHPDYITYLNFPRDKPYLEIGDHNLDWGQSIKQVAQWLDQNPQPGRTVYLAYFGKTDDAIAYYLGDRVQMLGKEMPSKGIVIASAVCLTNDGRFKELRLSEPSATLGHGTMYVFDLDQLGKKPG